MSSKQTFGVALILAGLAFFLAMYIEFEGLFLLGASIFFFVVYFNRGANKRYRNIGFLIPALALIYAAILMFISESESLRYLEDLYATLGITIVFALVYVCHTYWFKFSSWGKRHWPVFVVAGTGFASLGILLDEYLEYNVTDQQGKFVVALFLIACGIIVMFKEKARQRAKETTKKRIDD